MVQDQAPDAAPEEIAAVDELARLLEQYQTHLLAGSAFADTVRAQASSAAGTARPILVRLHANGADGVSKLENALRRPLSDDDRNVATEEVGSALKEVRALLSSARWHRRDNAGANEPRTSSPKDVRPSQATAPGQTRATTRNVAPWIWVGGGVAIGIALGVFGPSLPRSTGAIERLWILLQPIVATAAGAYLGSILFETGGTATLREIVRRRWLGIVVSSTLLVVTAPTAVDAAKDLIGQRAPSAPAPAVERTDAPVPAAPPTITKQADPLPAPTSETPSPAASTGRTQSAGAPSSVDKPRAPARPSSTKAADCAKLVERQSLGDELTTAERTFLASCRS